MRGVNEKDDTPSSFWLLKPGVELKTSSRSIYGYTATNLK
jgi:hypothetical protein